MKSKVDIARELRQNLKTLDFMICVWLVFKGEKQLTGTS
jgi:hypothetical protein